MVHHELVEYISTALKGGVAEPQVIQALSGVGWTMSDIQEALGVVKGETKNTDASFQSVIQRASQEAASSPTQQAQPAQTTSSPTVTAQESPANTASEPADAPVPAKHHTLAIILALLLIAAFIGGGLYSYTLYRARTLTRQAPALTEQAPLVPKDVATPRALFAEPTAPLAVTLSGTISKNKDAYVVKVTPLIFTHSFEESTTKDAASEPDASYMYIFKKAGKTLTQGPLRLSPGKLPTFSERVSLEAMPDSLALIETGSGTVVYESAPSSDPLPVLTLGDITFESPTTTLSWTSSASSSLYYYAEISNNHFVHTKWDASQEPADPHTVSVASTGAVTGSTTTYGAIENNTLSVPVLGLIAGDIQIAIYASDGFHTVSAFSKKVSIPDQPRKISLKITPPRQPLKETIFTLSASTSPTIANTTMRWVSSIDGVLFKPSATSSGASVSCSDLTPGKHTISGIATTQRGFVASSTILMTVPDPKKIDPTRYASWSPAPQCK